MNWQAVTAIVTAVVALCGFVHWALDSVVRQQLEPIRQDISVLRTAVFNHLAHGELPQEHRIRQRLGYE
ncbi:MAG: hypothetical protein ACRD1Y_11225 [Terriglobales bacterium]